MPVVHIKTFKSDPEIISAIAEDTTRSLCPHMELKPENVQVVFDEYTPDNWATGGEF